jgi:hypothetical protein
MGDLGREPARLTRRLSEFFETYRLRALGLGLKTVSAAPSLAELVREDDEGRYRARLVFQAIGFGCGDEMLIALWLAACGGEIVGVGYAHRRKIGSKLELTLRLPTGVSETFVSANHLDTAILRFLGIAFSNEKPVLDGVYPLPARATAAGSSTTPAEIRWVFRVLEWIQMFGGHEFCPSLIDQSHVSDVARAIVTAVVHGWLSSPPGGHLSRASVDEQARREALALLVKDAAVTLTITSEGRTMTRRLRFFQQLEGTSQAGLVQIRVGILKVLDKPDEGYEPEDLEEIRDELYAVELLLQSSRK